MAKMAMHKSGKSGPSIGSLRRSCPNLFKPIWGITEQKARVCVTMREDVLIVYPHQFAGSQFWTGRVLGYFGYCNFPRMLCLWARDAAVNIGSTVFPMSCWRTCVTSIYFGCVEQNTSRLHFGAQAQRTWVPSGVKHIARPSSEAIV